MANGTVGQKSVRWHKRLGAYLLAAGLIDEDTLARALELQKKESPVITSYSIHYTKLYDLSWSR